MAHPPHDEPMSEGVEMTDTEVETAAPQTARSRGGWRRPGRLIAVAAAAVVLAGSGFLMLNGKDEAVATDEATGGVAAKEVTAAELAKVSQTRVFFGHQSVGYNVLDGV